MKVLTCDKMPVVWQIGCSDSVVTNEDDMFAEYAQGQLDYAVENIDSLRDWDEWQHVQVCLDKALPFEDAMLIINMLRQNDIEILELHTEKSEEYCRRITMARIIGLKSVSDVERRLNDGIERTPEEREMCIKWLTEYMTANQMTLNELDNLCFEDSNWVFEQIFNYKITIKDKFVTKILSEYKIFKEKELQKTSQLIFDDYCDIYAMIEIRNYLTNTELTDEMYEKLFPVPNLLAELRDFEYGYATPMFTKWEDIEDLIEDYMEYMEEDE